MSTNPPAVDDHDARRLHDIRGPIFGELWGVVAEITPHLFRAYDQTEAYIDMFASFEDAKRAIEQAYIPPPPRG
jgi:hypothetical protein